MKKYRMSGNISTLIFMVVWCAVLIVMLSVFFNASSGAGASGTPMIIIPVVMLIIGLALLITQLTGVIRINNVKNNGRKATATIVESDLHHSKSTMYRTVVVKYKGDSGNEALSEFTIYKNLDSFPVGRSVPVYIYQDMACFDDKRFNDGVYSSYSEEDDIYSTKESDNYDNDSSDKCYCTKCGNKLNKNDIFCSQCGNRIK